MSRKWPLPLLQWFHLSKFWRKVRLHILHTAQPENGNGNDDINDIDQEDDKAYTDYGSWCRYFDACQIVWLNALEWGLHNVKKMSDTLAHPTPKLTLYLCFWICVFVLVYLFSYPGASNAKADSSDKSVSSRLRVCHCERTTTVALDRRIHDGHFWSPISHDDHDPWYDGQASLCCHPWHDGQV